jgi:hypothetical protein
MRASGHFLTENPLDLSPAFSHDGPQRNQGEKNQWQC